MPGAYGKSAPPNMQRILASIKTCCGRASGARDLFQFELTMRGQGIQGRNNMHVIGKRANKKLNVCEIEKGLFAAETWKRLPG